MYIIRDVFNTKPGKARDLVSKFKKAAPAMKKAGFKVRVMTDAVATYWTVVLEIEVSDIPAYFENIRVRIPEVDKAMQGYMELVNGGYREIFKVE